MITTPTRASHSAQVEMRMFVNGSVVPIAQLGPDFVILAQPPVAHPPARAEIEITVDGATDRFAVNLTAGLAAGEKRVPILVER